MYNLTVYLTSTFCSSGTQSPCRTPLPQAVVSERLALGGELLHIPASLVVFAFRNQRDTAKHSKSSKTYTHITGPCIHFKQHTQIHAKQKSVSMRLILIPNLKTKHWKGCKIATCVCWPINWSNSNSGRLLLLVLRCCCQVQVFRIFPPNG